MPLPVRPCPDAAPRTWANRVMYDVGTVSANSDPYSEFLSEEPGQAVAREPVFIIVPVPSEPPSDAAQDEPQDQFLSRERNVPPDVGLFRAFFRRMLLAPYRGVVGILMALYRGVVGILLALHRGVVGALLALYRGVVGIVLALHRGVVGTLLALHRGVVGALLALYRGVMGTLLAVLRSVVGTLLALHRGVVGTLLALRRCVVATYVLARRTTSEVARWTSRSYAGAIEGTTSIGIFGRSRFRRFAGDVRTGGRALSRLSGVATELFRAQLTRDIRTIERFMSMLGHRLSVVARSLHERNRVSLRVHVRNAQRLASARLAMRMPSRPRLEMRIPLWALRISRVRASVTNVRLVAFTGGTAVCALVALFFALQPDLLRLSDGSVAPVPDVVASEPSTDDYSATVAAATSGTIAVEPQGTAPQSVSAPMGVMSASMTVRSTPAGARVTVNGIGWGETPVTIRYLPPGQKVVRVTKEGYETQQRIISVSDDRRAANIRVTLLAPRQRR